MKLYKKNLFKQNYLFHRNSQFQKFKKTSSVFPGYGTKTKLVCTPANLFPQPPLYSVYTHYTLANSNLHQPLISFLYMIPSCKQY